MIRRLRDRISLTWWRFRETRDQAWSDGYTQAESEWEEYLLGKEAWIEQCEAAIGDLFKVMTDEQWRTLDPELREFLRAWV